jgi:hypothetical protein
VCRLLPVDGNPLDGVSIIGHGGRNLCILMERAKSQKNTLSQSCSTASQGVNTARQ